jgi:hypothetical protein
MRNGRHCAKHSAGKLSCGPGYTRPSAARVIGGFFFLTLALMAKLQIRLGPHGLRYAQPGTQFKLLGTVQEGMAIGALALLEDGSYAQVNGDFVRPLNTSKVEFTVGPKLQKTLPVPQAYPERAHAPAAAPVLVVVKKRRIANLPSE